MRGFFGQKTPEEFWKGTQGNMRFLKIAYSRDEVDKASFRKSYVLDTHRHPAVVLRCKFCIEIKKFVLQNYGWNR